MPSIAWSPSPALQHIDIATADSPFVTEAGARLDEVQLAFETWGTLNTARDNAILIFHALTGDSHVASHPDVPSDFPGWWEDLVGPGKPIDTNRFFVICANTLGSCYGSTGPASLAPDGNPYNVRFPNLSVRDLVHAQLQLVRALGVLDLAAVIGGSLGGMEAIEAALIAPDLVHRAVVIAASNRFHDQGIAYNEVQRRAIMLDPAWNGGNYDASASPAQGLAIARMLGMITYQCDQLMSTRFQRQPARYEDWPEFHGRFDVEGYLHYQGDKLASRFDANSYLYLSRAMDSHDIGRERGGLLRAAAKVQAACLFIGISSDILFPPHHVDDSAGLIRQTGGRARYVELETPHGHDAFLKDFEMIGAELAGFLPSSQEASDTGTELPRASNRASARTADVTASSALKGPRIPSEWSSSKKTITIDAR